MTGPRLDVAAPERRARVAHARADFPILSRPMRGKPLVYLDNVNTTQRPQVVLDALQRFYAEDNANVHRGAYELSERVTLAYEAARTKVQRLLGAADPREIVFVRGTTEAINLVARSFVRPRLGPGDEVLVTLMEHHSNIVPWQLVCAEAGAHLTVAPMDDRGVLVVDEFAQRLTPRTRFVALTHTSNALGTQNPVRELVALAHAHGVPVLVDGAQAVPHGPVDVQDLGCDFLAFSGHKVYGPFGIGALYGRLDLLESMPPFQGGGQMIDTVTFEKTTYAPPPARFEAGTPNVAGAIVLGTALDYVTDLGLDAIAAHEQDLLAYATAALQTLPNVRIYGTAPDKAAVIAFNIDGVHPHDAATVLDSEGIAVRAGHHCAQPVMRFFGVPATLRASFALYNTRADVDALMRGIHKTVELFRP